MKKAKHNIYGIFVSALLSFIMVMAGVGVTFVHCTHTGAVKAGPLQLLAMATDNDALDMAFAENSAMSENNHHANQLNADEHREMMAGNDDCEFTDQHNASVEGGECSESMMHSTSCVKVKTLQLLPSVPAPSFSFHFDCKALSAPFIVSLLPEPVVLAARRQLVPNTASGYYGTPRSYLSKLSVLII